MCKKTFVTIAKLYYIMNNQYIRRFSLTKVSSNRKNILRGSFGSALATLLARFLGLFRVMLEARVLGGAALASSWQLAFMIPNFFRRILGEGALAQALIPQLTHTEAELGIDEVKKQLSTIFCVLAMILAAISITISLAALAAAHFVTVSYVKKALLLLPMLMPYSIFICLVGVMTAVVNTRRVFFMASLNALILNIVLIAVLSAAQKMLNIGIDFLHIMAISVLFAGLLQLIHMAWLLKKNHIYPVFKKSIVPAKKILKELFTLALPGMVGGIAAHLSFLIDRALACYVGDYAVPALNYTERLVYLPIGIVAIALSSVLMTDMSHAAANGKFDELRDDLTMGLRYVWFLCAPLAIFMIFYREPVIRFFFKYGKFTEENVVATADAMLFYAMGIPAFCATKVLVTAFYARKKVKIPFYISLFCIVLNIPLSIMLMFNLKQGGIALATVISAMCNNALLLYFLKRDSFAPAMPSLLATVCRSLIFSAAAAYPALHYSQICKWSSRFAIPGVPDAVPLLLCGCFFAVVYLALSLVARAPEPREIYSSLFSSSSRKKE